MVKLSLIRDVNGFNTFGLPISDVKFGGILAAGAHQEITVPASFTSPTVIFGFEPGASVWVAKNATAALPTGTVGTINSELNPTVRGCLGGDTFSFITNDTTAEFGVLIYDASASR